MIECRVFESTALSIYVSSDFDGTKETHCCSLELSNERGNKKLTHLFRVFKLVLTVFPAADWLLSLHQSTSCEKRLSETITKCIELGY